MVALAEALLEHETLTQEQIYAIAKAPPITPPSTTSGPSTDGGHRKKPLAVALSTSSEESAEASNYPETANQLSAVPDQSMAPTSTSA